LFEETLEFILNKKHNDVEFNATVRIILDQIRNGDKVYRLRKTLYGLRQSGRNWIKRFDEVLRTFGVKPSSADQCVYYSGSGEDLTLILVYVDDLLVASKNMSIVEALKKHLLKQFEIRDLGDASQCLDLEFGRSGENITLCQRYIKNILDRFNMSECKPVSTPMEVEAKLTKSESREEEDVKRLPYRELIGSLMYLAVGTRPDIMFAVSYLSQFNDCFDKTHWIAAKRVLRYIKKTINYRLEFKYLKIPLIGYSDADWDGCVVDRRSRDTRFS